MDLSPETREKRRPFRELKKMGFKMKLELSLMTGLPNQRNKGLGWTPDLSRTERLTTSSISKKNVSAPKSDPYIRHSARLVSVNSFILPIFWLGQCPSFEFIYRLRK